MKRIVGFVLLFSATVYIGYSQSFDMELYGKRRNIIAQFMDTYEGAYEKMDIEYLQDVFGEEALIITETNVIRVESEKTRVNGRVKVLNKNEYKRIVESKSQYIQRLKTVFKDNVAIRLNVANMKIYVHRDYHDIYGLSFLQSWKSMDNSSLLLEDDNPGYIFMMIDFKNGNDFPIIHVRTWQPDSHIKKESDIYSLYDFVIL